MLRRRREPPAPPAGRPGPGHGFGGGYPPPPPNCRPARHPGDRPRSSNMRSWRRPGRPPGQPARRPGRGHPPIPPPPSPRAPAAGRSGPAPHPCARRRCGSSPSPSSGRTGTGGGRHRGARSRPPYPASRNTWRRAGSVAVTSTPAAPDVAACSVNQPGRANKARRPERPRLGPHGQRPGGRARERTYRRRPLAPRPGPSAVASWRATSETHPNRRPRPTRGRRAAGDRSTRHPRPGDGVSSLGSDMQCRRYRRNPRPRWPAAPRCPVAVRPLGSALVRCGRSPDPAPRSRPAPRRPAPWPARPPPRNSPSRKRRSSSCARSPMGPARRARPPAPWRGRCPWRPASS